MNEKYEKQWLKKQQLPSSLNMKFVQVYLFACPQQQQQQGSTQLAALCMTNAWNLLKIKIC